jgi:hypothetical protein
VGYGPGGRFVGRIGHIYVIRRRIGHIYMIGGVGCGVEGGAWALRGDDDASVIRRSEPPRYWF